MAPLQACYIRILMQNFLVSSILLAFFSVPTITNYIRRLQTSMFVQLRMYLGQNVMYQGKLQMTLNLSRSVRMNGW